MNVNFAANLNFVFFPLGLVFANFFWTQYTGGVI